MSDVLQDSEPKFTVNKFELEVTSGSDGLYANGRQQVRVTVRIQALVGGTAPYHLTAEDLEHLSLIEYNKVGVPLPFIGEGEATGWGYTNVESEYRYYTGTAAALDSSKNNETPNKAAWQYIDFYVQTTASSQLKIGAQIWDGSTKNGVKNYIATNDDDTAYGWVTPKPVSVPRYSPTNVISSRVRIENDSTLPYAWDTVDYYPFSLSPSSGAGAFLKVITEPRGIYMYDASPDTRGSCVGWANIDDDTISYFSTLTNGPKKFVNGYPQVGQGALVLLRRNTLYKPSGLPLGTDSITVRDEYGNDYTILFGFGDTRSTLVFN